MLNFGIFKNHSGGPIGGQISTARSQIYIRGGGGAENAGVENAGVDSRGGKCRSGKCRSDNVWKAVKQKIKILKIFN